MRSTLLSNPVLLFCLSVLLTWFPVQSGHAVSSAAMRSTVVRAASGATGDKPVRLPEGSREGWLPNGLHYIVLPNEQPRHTTEFRLVMRVGSLEEEEGQGGVAHFLEHTAFNGSAHFPGKSMVNYFESLGMKFGRDINAFTGFDRTIYWLTVPMEKSDTVISRKSLLAIRDWLCGLQVDPIRTSQERGIILEELQGYRQTDPFYRLKMGVGRHLRHLPLGTADDINKTDCWLVSAFYKRWYQPRWATVLVVGNVDADATVRQLREMFATVPAGKPDTLKDGSMRYAPGVTMDEDRDSLSSLSKVELIIPHASVVARTLSSHARYWRGAMLVKALDRLMPRRSAVSDNWYLASTSHFVVSCEGEGRDSLLAGVRRTAALLHSLVDCGFPDTLVSEVRAGMKASVTQVPADCQSAELCENLIDYVVTGDRLLCHDDEVRAVRDSLMATTPAMLRDLLRQWLACGKEHLLIALSNNLPVGVTLTEDDIMSEWRKGWETKTRPVSYTPAHAEEMAHISTPPVLLKQPSFDDKAIAADRYYPHIKVRELRLRNGLTLILRPTHDDSDLVQLRLLGRGGTGDLSNDDYPALEGTVGYVEMGKMKHVDADTLSLYLSQENMGMTSGMMHRWHEMLATAPRTKVGEMARLMMEKIYEADIDSADLRLCKQEMLQSLNQETTLEKMMRRDVGRQLAGCIDSLVGNVHPMASRKLTAAQIKALDSQRMLNYYRNLFGNPEGTAVIVTGQFDTDSVMRELVPVFAGMAPVSERSMKNASAPVLPDGIVVRHLPGDNGAQTVFDYVYFGSYRPSLKGSLMLKLMRDVVQSRLLSVLRERHNVVYSPYTMTGYTAQPEGLCYFDLSASADSVNMPLIDQLIKNIAKQLSRHDIPQEELERDKQSFRETKAQALTDDATSEWKRVLGEVWTNGESLADYDNYDQVLASITTRELRKMFSRIFRPDRYAVVYVGSHATYQHNNKH